MADKETSYGKTTKRIVFTDTDHRHAQFVVRLRHDSLTQSDFFRNVITGYIEGDQTLQQFVDTFKPQSAKRKNRSTRDVRTGKKKAKDLGLDANQIENIFDLIAEEHPDL